MNKIIFLIGLISLQFIFYTGSSQRRGKYEMKNQTKAESRSTPQLGLPATEKKEIYRIDYLLSINLDNLPEKQQVVKNFSNNSVIGLNFYEGILLAIDSLEKRENMYYDIFVHDIGNNSLDELLQSGRLDSTDLIIGLVQPSEIAQVAKFAKSRKVNFISALSPFDGEVKDNPFMIIPQATINTHLGNIVKYADYNKSYMNTLVLYRDNQSDESAYRIIKNQVNKKSRELRIVGEKLDIDQVKQYLVKGQKNLIYTTFLSPQLAQNLLTQLNGIANDYEFEIIGMPTWKGLPILTDETLNKSISVYLSYPFRYDEEVDKRLYMRNRYSRFNRGIPSELVFRGFETTLWAADNLLQHGTIFNEHIGNSEAFSNIYKVNFKTVGNTPLYFENQNVYIYKYNDGTLSIIE